MGVYGNIRYIASKLMVKAFNPRSIKQCRIDKSAHIGSGTQIVNSSLGKYSYVGPSCVVLSAEIGSFCSIAKGTYIGGASHPLDRVSTSPVFYGGRNVLKRNFSKFTYKQFRQTRIGNDVWIAANCMIKGGCSIGDGAVIGMGSVLTKDVGPYEVWAGNPAKLIKKRFDEDTINDLLQTKWWTLDDSELSKLNDYFSEPREFILKLRLI